MSKTPALVGVNWIKSNLDNPKVVVLDASWYSPDIDNDALMEYREAHIPGALFFDIAAISDQNTDLPNMLPSLTQFEQQISAMGIDNDDYVVAYDSQGVFSAARCWWMFRYFGHDRVSVLDGGLPAWLAQNLPVKTGNEKPKKTGKFYGKVRRDLLREITDMEQNVESKAAQIIDLRSRERFEGTMAEPWPGSGRGHIPGSVNLPYKTLLRPNGSMKGVEELQIKVNDMRLKLDKPIVASCGSGISACVAALAFYTMGKEDVAVYDGSWAEWGRKHKK